MCNSHNNKNKLHKGAALEHGKAHEQDHNHWSRRSFLKNLGIIGGGAFMLGKIPVSASVAPSLNMALNNANTDRVLVMIRLKGGNDGLNTIIPLYEFDTYANFRPTIHVPESQSWNLSNDFAMPNFTNSFQSLWGDGKMKVVHNVGYPEQNLSHFRSSDIWASAVDSNQPAESGFLGRYFGDLYPDYLTNPPVDPPAVQIGSIGNMTFSDPNNTSMGIAVSNPEQLFNIAQTGQLYDVTNVPDCYHGEQVGYIRAVANTTFIYAERIKEAFDASSNSATYQSNLGEQLGLVARLIKGNLGAKVYMVSIDGFDTHANQAQPHETLLNNLSVDVKNFYDDLEAGGEADRVLSMTISEFGRRIEENASNGTDHGAAAPMMFFGSGLNGRGFVGENPSLTDVDDIGNLNYHIDFRSVYATVLENWLCIDPDIVDTVLMNSFDRLEDLELVCQDVTSTSVPATSLELQHHAIYKNRSEVIIRYKLPETMSVKVEIMNVLGQPVAELFNGTQMPGQHDLVFKNYHVATGVYYYRILAGGRVFSQPLQVAR